MAQNSNKEKHISARVTNGTHSKLTTYAKANNMTLSKALETLLEKGLQSELDPLATRKDIELLKAENKQRDNELEKSLILLNETIKNQPIQIQQQLPAANKEHQSDVKRQGLFRRLFKS